MSHELESDGSPDDEADEDDRDSSPSDESDPALAVRPYKQRRVTCQSTGELHPIEKHSDALSLDALDVTNEDAYGDERKEERSSAISWTRGAASASIGAWGPSLSSTSDILSSAVSIVDSLHDIELQLCMQSLDYRSILVASRTCRRLCGLVQQARMWHQAAPIRVSAIHLPRIEASLLRHAPILVEVNLAAMNLGSLASQLASMRNLASIELNRGGSTASVSFSHVQPLVDLLRDFQAMHRVRSIRVLGHRPPVPLPPLPISLIDAVMELPHLRSMHLEAVDLTNDLAGRLARAENLSCLTHLSNAQWTMVPIDQFGTLLQSANLQASLKSLTLFGYELLEVMPDRLAALSEMHQLTSLHLHHCRAVVVLLPSIAPLRSLHRLCLTNTTFHTRAWLTADSVAQIDQKLPHVARIDLHLSQTPDGPEDHHPHSPRDEPVAPECEQLVALRQIVQAQPQMRIKVQFQAQPIVDTFP